MFLWLVENDQRRRHPDWGAVLGTAASICFSRDSFFAEALDRSARAN
jgi:hypothetical protein